MKITNSLSQNNQTPNFKGYVGKSLKKLIKDAANEAISLEIYKRNAMQQTAKKTYLDEIKNRADSIIKNLESIMEPLHKNTSLELEVEFLYNKRSDNNVFLKLVNNKLKMEKKMFEVFNCYADTAPFDVYIEHHGLVHANPLKFNPRFATIGKTHEFKPLKYPFAFLMKFEDFLDRTSLFIHESVQSEETELFENFANQEVIFPMLRAKRADKLAPEFGVPANWVEKLKAEKLLRSKNNDIAKKIFSQ